MASCKECLHYDLCSSIEGLLMRVLLAGDKAEERCKLFKLAADVEEVVRCKDCVNYDAWKQQSVKWKGKALCCRRYSRKVKPDDFCSYGERRTDNDL